MGDNGKENGNYYSILGSYLGGCQNYGPLFGALNIRCRIIIGIQKGPIILTTTHIRFFPTNPAVGQGIGRERTLTRRRPRLTQISGVATEVPYTYQTLLVPSNRGPSVGI